MFIKQILRNFTSFERRVVVTGIGMVSPLGVNYSESWKNLKEYKSGIKDLSKSEYAKDLPGNCKYGATIPKEFDSKAYRTLVNIIFN